MAPSASQSFPFLRLPKDLRRRIYTLLPDRVTYLPSHRGTGMLEGKPVIVLVLHYIERSIIQTCHLLSEEAEPVLEIETMKLSPPQMICHCEYFYLVPELLNGVRATMDEHVWQRLRLRDDDRRNLSTDNINRLLWTRLAGLQLLSHKKIRIGLYISRNAHQAKFMANLRQTGANIFGPQWWEQTCVTTRPRFEVWMECKDVRENFVMRQAVEWLEAERVKALNVTTADRDIFTKFWGMPSLGWVVGDENEDV